MEEFIHIKRLLVFEDIINRPADFMGKDPKGFPLVVLSFESGHVLFGFFRFPEHEDGRLITSPFQMVIADFAVGFAGPFSV